MLHCRRITLLLLAVACSGVCASDEQPAASPLPALTQLGSNTITAAETAVLTPIKRVVEKSERIASSAEHSGKQLGDRVKQRLTPEQHSLELTLIGVDGALRDNINAYLSQLPQTPAERATYLFTFEDKVQKAMHALGYYHGSVTPVLQRDQQPWQLQLTIDPGQPVRYQQVQVDVQGQAETDPAFTQRLAQVAIKPGDVVNHGDYERLKTDLISLGLLRGYFDGSMVQQQIGIDRQQQQAELQLVYDSKQRYTFGEVDFLGSDLDQDVLQSMVPFNRHQPYHNDQVSELTGTLLSVGYFKDVKVLPQPQQELAATVPIEVQLTPAPSHSYELGAGYATDTKARVSITWRTPQINRRGHSQETRLEISKSNPELSFEYRIPLEHPLNDLLQFGSSFGKEEFGDLESTLIQASVSRKTVYTNSWTRRYYLRYLNEEWQQAGQQQTADYLFPGISFSKTRRHGPALDPSSGFRQLYTVEYGTPLDSEAKSTTRLRGQWRWVASPFDRHRVTSRLDAGLNLVSDSAAQQLAPSLRFFAGGDQTVRGFEYQSLAPTINNNGVEQVVGGRFFGAASVEYQYYLSNKWRLATFADAGNAFDERDKKAIEWAYSVGLGLHWISPIGPVRADVGYGLSEQDAPIRLHITIGAEL